MLAKARTEERSMPFSQFAGTSDYFDDDDYNFSSSNWAGRDGGSMTNAASTSGLFATEDQDQVPAETRV